MANEMVDRVAKAIHGLSDWDSQHPRTHDAYRQFARVAIEALGIPNDAMLTAMCEASGVPADEACKAHMYDVLQAAMRVALTPSNDDRTERSPSQVVA